VKPANAHLEKIYERDQSTDAFIIAVAIEKYCDVFNELDPAPLGKRDYNNDLRVFLENCSSDIPLKHDVVLQFNLADEIPDTTNEEQIKSAFNTYFSFAKSLMDAEVRTTYNRSVLYTGASILLLLTAYYLRTPSPDNIFYRTLIEGINISGWVFLWEAVSNFAFGKKETRNKRLHYKRLGSAQVRFKYVPIFQST